jgi:hypothetical protein
MRERIINQSLRIALTGLVLSMMRFARISRVDKACPSAAQGATRLLDLFPRRLEPVSGSIIFIL